MSLIFRLPQILEACRQQYQQEQETMEGHRPISSFHERIVGGATGNMLAWCDNLAFMQSLLKDGYGGKLKLIYIDPPFYSKANYDTSTVVGSEKGQSSRIRSRAYGDVWENGMEEYLSMLALRLLYMKELLAAEGGIWVHLDWHVVHYVKILMDEIFGEGNFINEVIWTYKSGGVSKRHFARKHDTLLYYGKTKDYYFYPVKEKSYNRGMKPYRFKGVEEFQDETGWYTMVNKKDVWQIDMVGRTSGERTGYATQKPELLLEQILESCTREGDLCADFFCGSGTLAAVAARKNRNFITCDSGRLAISHTYSRLMENGAAFSLLGDIFASSKAGAAGELVIRGAGGCPELHIKEYQPEALEGMTVSKKDREKLEELIKENPMQLITGGSIGVETPHGVYEPKDFFRWSGNGVIVFHHLQLESCLSSDKIRAEVTDVFGNCIEVKLSRIYE